VFAIDLPHARRLALRVVLGQAGVTAIVALIAWALAGGGAGCSALLGGGIATAGSLAMVGVVFGGLASGGPERVLGAFYTGEAVKLALIVVLFVAVLKLVRVVPLAMFAGFAATYLVYWIALLGVLPAAGAARGR
jgi:ATP synthase protein I